MKLPPVHHHPLDGSTLLPILRPLLPHPIALYRRLQHPFRSSSSYALATFTLDTATEALPSCFCAAFIDRSRRPETEVWIFLSGQSEQTKRCPPSDGEHCPLCAAALLSTIKHIADLPLPESIHTDASTMAQAAQAKQSKASNNHASAATDDYSRHLVDPDLMLIGSLAQLCVEILMAHGLIRTDLPGPNLPYQKFIIRTARLTSVNTVLPEGLAWGEMSQEHFAMVRARTPIPRQDKTLAILPSVAIFPTSSSGEATSPIAWGFIGMDGALMSLHTEPEYRGRGLAKALTTKLFNEKLCLLDATEGEQEGGWWAHSDAALTNKESQGVARALGGVEGWLCYWVRADLRKAEGLTDGGEEK